jgi:diguanylate cyclase (GGDEF)-like protein
MPEASGEPELPIDHLHEAANLANEKYGHMQMMGKNKNKILETDPEYVYQNILSTEPEGAQILTDQETIVAKSKDSLTGLPDRAVFQELLKISQHERRHGEPNNVPAWQSHGFCLMIDIDRFKQVNDEHGHGVGDQVIATLAKSIKSCIREKDDIAVRVGGEEILVLLGDTVDDNDFSNKDNQDRWITMVQEFQSPGEGEFLLISDKRKNLLIEEIKYGDVRNNSIALLKAIIVINKARQLAAKFMDDQKQNNKLSERKIMRTICVGIGSYDEYNIGDLADAASTSEKEYNDQLAEFYKEPDDNQYRAKVGGRNQAVLLTMIDGTTFNYKFEFPNYEANALIAPQISTTPSLVIS